MMIFGIGGCASGPRKAEIPRKGDQELSLDSAFDDVRLGMTKADVMTAWGQPQETYVAGHPEKGNEKWVYFVGLSSQLGRANARAIYFEQGLVSGWETSHRPVR